MVLTQSARARRRRARRATLLICLLACVTALTTACGSDSGGSSAAGASASRTTSGTSKAASVPASALVSSGKLQFCSDISFPPFESYTPGNKPMGSDIDIGTALAKRWAQGGMAEHRLRRHHPGAAGASSATPSCPGLYDKASRRKVVDFVDYALLGNSIVVPKGNPHHVKSLADLSGLKVGVQSGTTLRLQLVDAQTRSCLPRARRR